MRSNNELSRARAVVKQAEQKALELSDRVEERVGRISIGTMHLAKEVLRTPARVAAVVA